MTIDPLDLPRHCEDCLVSGFELRCWMCDQIMAYGNIGNGQWPIDDPSMKRAWTSYCPHPEGFVEYKVMDDLTPRLQLSG